MVVNVVKLGVVGNSDVVVSGAVSDSVMWCWERWFQVWCYVW